MIKCIVKKTKLFYVYFFNTKEYTYSGPESSLSWLIDSENLVKVLILKFRTGTSSKTIQNNLIFIFWKEGWKLFICIKNVLEFKRVGKKVIKDVEKLKKRK